MDSKTIEAYTAVFECIVRLIPEYEIQEVLTDYENALKTALRNVFPNIILHGCWFHYKQVSVIKFLHSFHNKLAIKILFYNEYKSCV